MVKEFQEELAYLEEKLQNLSLKKQSLLTHYKESGVEDLRLEYERKKQKIEKVKQSIHSKELTLKELELEANNLQKEIDRRLSFLEKVEEEIRELKKREEGLKSQKEELERELERTNQQAYELYKAKDRLEEEIRNLQSQLGRLKIEEENLSEDINKLNLEKARLEERLEEALQKLKELGYEGEEFEVKEGVSRLKDEISKVLSELTKLGSVNFRAEEELKELEERYKDYRQRQERLREEKDSIKELIREVEGKKLKAFMETYRAINKNLKAIFSELSPGGKAYMVLEKEEDPFSGGVNLVVKPRGKEVQYLEAISGGEKTLAALSLIFAIQDYKPSPFYYFDEVDAHLDEANARRVGELIKERSRKAQFIVVTLREVLASFADKVIGVSARGGLSKVFALENPTQLLTG